MEQFQNVLITAKNWFDIMIRNKWLEHPLLAPDRIEIPEDK
jgi:hypothetical protein